MDLTILKDLWPIYAGTVFFAALLFLTGNEQWLLPCIISGGISLFFTLGNLRSRQKDQEAQVDPPYTGPEHGGYTILSRARWGFSSGYAAATPEQFVFLQTKQQFKAGAKIPHKSLVPDLKETAILNIEDFTSFTQCSRLFGGDEIILPRPQKRPVSIIVRDAEFMVLFLAMSDEHAERRG